MEKLNKDNAIKKLVQRCIEPFEEIVLLEESKEQMFTLDLDINKVEVKDVVETILKRDIVRYVNDKLIIKQVTEEISLTLEEFKESVECNVKAITEDLKEQGYIIKEIL